MEIWKDIEGFEGLYQVSNLGIVRSLTHTVTMPHRDGGTRTRTFDSQVITPWISRRGYYTVTLKNRGHKKHFTIHRLIATYFIENPNNFPCINHKNGIKADNRIENIEWCTQSYNVQHAHNTGLNRGSGKLVFDELTGVFYNSCMEASRTLKIPNSTLGAMLGGALINKTSLRYA